jgi:hypothetical protein
VRAPRGAKTNEWKILQKYWEPQLQGRLGKLPAKGLREKCCAQFMVRYSLNVAGPLASQSHAQHPPSMFESLELTSGLAQTGAPRSDFAAPERVLRVLTGHDDRPQEVIRALYEEDGRARGF